MPMTTTDQQAARRVTYQLETLWDYDYEPTHQELETLETAKKNQWNGSTAIDWSRPVGTEGPVLNVQIAFSGTNFFGRLTPEELRLAADVDHQRGRHELRPGRAGLHRASIASIRARRTRASTSALGPFVMPTSPTNAPLVESLVVARAAQLAERSAYRNEAIPALTSP
jgi:hypothetical protein